MKKIVTSFGIKDSLISDVNSETVHIEYFLTFFFFNSWKNFPEHFCYLLWETRKSSIRKWYWKLYWFEWNAIFCRFYRVAYNLTMKPNQFLLVLSTITLNSNFWLHFRIKNAIELWADCLFEMFFILMRVFHRGPV